MYLLWPEYRLMVLSLALTKRQGNCMFFSTYGQQYNFANCTLSLSETSNNYKAEDVFSSVHWIWKRSNLPKGGCTNSTYSKNRNLWCRKNKDQSFYGNWSIKFLKSTNLLLRTSNNNEAKLQLTFSHCLRQQASLVLSRITLQFIRVWITCIITYNGPTTIRAESNNQKEEVHIQMERQRLPGGLSQTFQTEDRHLEAFVIQALP